MKMRRFMLSLAAISLLLPALSGNAEPLKILLVSGSFEYDSDQCFTILKEHLDTNYEAETTLLSASGEWENFPGLEALETCDVAVFYTRRLRISGEQLEHVKKYCQSGRPLVGFRTASHGFENFLEFDKEVLGGNYQRHFSNNLTQKVAAVADAREHPILKGVANFVSPSSLYRNTPLSADCRVLMSAEIPNEKAEPAVWTREYKGARIVYIEPGKVEDFQMENFRRLASNAIFWAAGREPQIKKAAP